MQCHLVQYSMTIISFLKKLFLSPEGTEVIYPSRTILLYLILNPKKHVFLLMLKFPLLWWKMAFLITIEEGTMANFISNKL